MNIEQIPNFVGQVQAAAGLITLALGICIVLIAWENWPELPKRR